MKTETALTYRSRAIKNLISVYSNARICKYTSAQLNEEIEKNVYSTIVNCPAWVRAYVKGYDVALRDSLMQNNLEFCYKVKGILYSTHKQTKKPSTNRLYNKGLGVVLAKANNGAFYWLHTEKVFF